MFAAWPDVPNQTSPVEQIILQPLGSDVCELLMKWLEWCFDQFRPQDQLQLTFKSSDVYVAAKEQFPPCCWIPRRVSTSLGNQLDSGLLVRVFHPALRKIQPSLGGSRFNDALSVKSRPEIRKLEDSPSSSLVAVLQHILWEAWTMVCMVCLKIKASQALRMTSLLWVERVELPAIKSIFFHFLKSKVAAFFRFEQSLSMCRRVCWIDWQYSQQGYRWFTTSSPHSERLEQRGNLPSIKHQCFTTSLKTWR